jgi:hypothetical protein
MMGKEVESMKIKIQAEINALKIRRVVSISQEVEVEAQLFIFQFGFMLLLLGHHLVPEGCCSYIPLRR